MIAIAGTAVFLCLLFYLALGLFYSLQIRGLGDLLPILSGRKARVENSREFSSSTVAATLSLATVIVAFYELVPMLGFWLIWTAITTAAGLLVFATLAARIWRKMLGYDYRPTLHSYLGTEFGSRPLAIIASVCTATGYLSAFAVELTVGSRFLSGLIPEFPPLWTVIIMSIISFLYTGLGGFRVVVVTDRIQMWFMWSLIAAMSVYYVVTASREGFVHSVQHIPVGLRTPHWAPGLLPFILGIALMNLFTFVSNMGLWQRIAGSAKSRTVVRGVWSSVIGAGFSWSLLVFIAVGSFMFVTIVPHENLLITTLKSMSSTPLGKVTIFITVLGLYGAMLSTASTQLIAVSHTIYEDILGTFRSTSLHERVENSSELTYSRIVLVVSAAAAITIMEFLRAWGFTVADLAFAVYGAALGLVPPILLTLIVNQRRTQQLKGWAIWAVSTGFASSWVCAAYGRLHGNANLVFLSPVVSSMISTTILVMGSVLLREKEALLATASK